MKSKLLLRSITYSILVVLASLLFFWHLSLEDRIALEEGRTHLLAGKYQQAQTRFEKISGSLFYGKEAELGFVLSRVLQSGIDTELLYVNRTADAQPFALPHLMQTQFRNANYPKCLELTAIATNFSVAKAPLYQAACFLELHKFKKAQDIYEQLSPVQKRNPLAVKIGETLRIKDENIVRIVRDRRGQFLAGIDAEGKYHFEDPRLAHLIQPIIRKAINRHDEMGSVRLSIDLDLSLFAWRVLQDRRGSIVLLKPGTDEVLVAVSDPVTTEEMGEGSSPAFEQQLEPASISKLITTVAAMRNEIDPDQRLKGLDSVPAKRYEGGILYNPAQLGILSGLNEAMAGSCNVAFAELGTDVGWQSMVAELKDFGFDSHTGNPFDLGHILKTGGTERELADLSIGLEHTEITTLHCGLLASVFANQGYWREPVFIIAEDGLLGASPQPLTIATEKHQIVAPEWLPTIHKAMRAVTGWGGTARGISPSGFPVAMKTGTGGGDWENGFHINYVGFGPYPDAEVIFAVRITNVRRSRDVRRQGYMTTRQILNELQRRIAEKSLE